MAEGVVQSIETTADPDTVFAVAAAVDAYPEWVSGVREVEVLERDKEGRPRRVRFVVDGVIREITYVLVYEFNQPEEIAWTAEPGKDIAEMEGRYEFHGMEDGGTEIVYALKVTPAFPLPGFLRRQAEKLVMGPALRGLKKRAEQEQ